MPARAAPTATPVKGIFGQGGIKNPLLAEFLLQTPGGAKHAAGVIHPLTHDKDLGVMT